jgi:hypothetical protein
MSARVSLARRFGAGLAATAVVVGVSFAGAPAAVADVQQGLGHETTPAQPYLNNPDPSDWLGSYVVGGKQVWCVQFAHLAPDSNEQYQPGAALKTKWGTDLAPDVAADISYLLLRYADTDDADDAAALAHLLHSWTAAPQNPDQLLPTNDFRHIAYDAPFHLAKLPAAAQAAVPALTADAAANRGPWTATVTAPQTPQTIGTAADWTIEVKNAAGTGVPDVPVTVTAVDATFTGADGDQVTTGTVSTDADGAPLALPVTPTGAAPKLAITLASPAEVPVVQQAVEVDAQRIVSTGGEKELTANAETSATPPPTTTTTTTTQQLPSTIPAGDTPTQEVATAAVSGPLSGGAWFALGAVVLAAGLLTWQLVRRRAGRHARG